jgi:transcriptional regulator of arginine metabolism
VTAAHDTRARRAAIGELVRMRRIGTQAQLRELLAARGFDVTQATLSRDLGQLRARRVSLPGGGAAYELAGAPAATGDEVDGLAALGPLVTGIVDGAAQVVVHTRPGAAPAVAALLDQARLPTVIGTLAGDDTIFIVPAKRTPPAKLARSLAALFAMEIPEEIR